nr:blocked early in transport 1 [Ipomoea batatas]
MKPVGTVFWQALTRALRATGTSRLIPSTLAFRAVQRQAATSKSASPARRVQHGLVGACPSSMLTSPPSRLAHTPSFSVSRGQYGFTGGIFGGSLGVHVPHAVVRVARRRRERVKMVLVAMAAGRISFLCSALSRSKGIYGSVWLGAKGKAALPNPLRALQEECSMGWFGRAQAQCSLALPADWRTRLASVCPEGSYGYHRASSAAGFGRACAARGGRLARRRKGRVGKWSWWPWQAGG